MLWGRCRWARTRWPVHVAAMYIRLWGEVRTFWCSFMLSRKSRRLPGSMISPLTWPVRE